MVIIMNESQSSQSLFDTQENVENEEITTLVPDTQTNNDESSSIITDHNTTINNTELDEFPCNYCKEPAPRLIECEWCKKWSCLDCQELTDIKVNRINKKPPIKGHMAL